MLDIDLFAGDLVLLAAVDETMEVSDKSDLCRRMCGSDLSRGWRVPDETLGRHGKAVNRYCSPNPSEIVLLS